MQVFIKKYLVTAVLIIVAVVVVLTMYGDYVSNPWTRDGQVQAQVVQIASRVSGPIVDLPVEDNALVRQGDVLWKIDPAPIRLTWIKLRLSCRLQKPSGMMLGVKSSALDVFARKTRGLFLKKV